MNPMCATLTVRAQELVAGVVGVPPGELEAPELGTLVRLLTDPSEQVRELAGAVAAVIGAPDAAGLAAAATGAAMPAPATSSFGGSSSVGGGSASMQLGTATSAPGGAAAMSVGSSSSGGGFAGPSGSGSGQAAAELASAVFARLTETLAQRANVAPDVLFPFRSTVFEGLKAVGDSLAPSPLQQRGMNRS